MLVSFLSICYNGIQSTVFRRKFRGASPYKGDLEDMGKVSAFLKRKNVLFSAKRYGIDAMGAMAQGLFASLLIGTIIKTLGQQLNVQFLIDAGNFAQQVAGPAMAVSIGAALSAPQLVLYSLIAVGMAANKLGGAGGPLAVYFITIVASECGKIVSKETKVDILVTPAVTILVGVGLSVLCAPAIGAAASSVGDFIKWATNLQPLLMGILVSVVVGMALTLPISSAAICAALSLTGLAGGAAVAGCCAQMVGFAVMSFRENGVGGLVSQGLGTSMLQMPNIIRNPRVWIPPTLASAITGPIATCLFHLEMNGGFQRHGHLRFGRADWRLHRLAERHCRRHESRDSADGLGWAYPDLLRSPRRADAAVRLLPAQVGLDQGRRPEAAITRENETGRMKRGE